jgi:FdhD protein
VVGWAALEGRLPLSGTILLASGRAGFEIAQKALVAGIPILASISGPSSLAVDLARENGLALCAFLRGDTFTVYAGAERIRSP